MPRSNIPYRSMRYFSNRRYTSFSRSHFRPSTDTLSSDNQQGHVNNIIVFPKYSDTTINFVSNDSKTLPFGNLHKKIKGRKRKDKQRLKKKQILEVDVKPVINKVKSKKEERMKPKLNQHIIFLSDSESENQEMPSLENPSKNSVLNETNENRDCDEDDDVIFVETPAAEIIEIEDSIEPNENSDTLEQSNERISSPDDFLDNAHVNLKSKFDFEPDVAEFKQAEFLKPSAAPIDMSESGSISSVSDVSASVGMNVFKLIDFPQEKVNLFDDDNLEKFRDAITPKRLNKKDVINDEAVNTENDNLPTLSDIHPEDHNRKQRGRSIIKELVNDRAFVLLSTAQKKNKSKKRKSKDDSSETIQEDRGNESSESVRKKKKKKTKKKGFDNEDDEYDTPRKDVIDNEKSRRKKEFKEVYEGDVSRTLGPQTSLSDSSLSEISSNIKKSKKNKQKDVEVSVEENSEVRKKRSKKNVPDISDGSNQSEPMLDTTEDNHERKKKKNKKTSEASSENDLEQKKCDPEDQVHRTQESNEEKKKKRSRKNTDVSINEESMVEPPPTESEDNEERKKKKVRRTSEISVMSTEEKEIEPHSTEFTEEKKKKRNKKILVGSDTVPCNTNIEEKEVIKEERDAEDSAKCTITDQLEEGGRDINEDKKKKKTKKTLEVMNSIIPVEKEHLSEIDKSSVGDKIEKTRVDIQVLSENTEIKNSETIEKESKLDEKLHQESTEIVDDKKEAVCEDVDVAEIIETPEVQIDEQCDSKQIIEVNALQIEEENINSKKRTIEITENNAKKLKLETFVDNEVEEKRNEASKEIQNNEAESGLEEKNIVDITNDGLRKRKQETSIAETVSCPHKIKKMKMNEEEIVENVEIPQLEVLEHVEAEDILLEDIKEKVIEEHDVSSAENEITCHSNEIANSLINPTERGSIDNVVVPCDKSLGDLCEKELMEPQDFKSECPMVVVDNEGHIDMKLTSVFTSEKSIFGEGNTFSNDIEIVNFLDKNPSWNTHPSRFFSYNGSLFDGTNTLDASTSDVDLTKEYSELQSNQNLSTNIILDTAISTVSVEESNEKINVKKEKKDNETCTSGTNENVSFRDEVVVKLEKDAEKSNSNEPINPCNEELPNEIEEIVKEKDNHHTVKKLCEFLEEVTDPNDILKKVSLLKQAYEEKSQNTSRSSEAVEITYENDDVVSVSSGGSSVLCIDDDVSVVSIDDDITLANCDIVDVEKNEEENSQIRDLVGKTNDTLKNNDNNEISQNTLKQSDIENVKDTRKNDQVPMIQSTPKRLARTENMPSTSRTASNSAIQFMETQPFQKGLDKYEVEDVQACMSDNPKLWRILAEDIHPIKLPSKGKRCIKCREIGHLSYNCPNRLKLPKCSLCGYEGHLDFKCPRRLCIQCGRKSPIMQNFCEHCKHYKNLTCASCGNRGHPKNKCPDMWRRYHLTVNHGPLVQGDTMKLKDKKYLWCSFCAKSGHVESDCDVSWKRSRNFQPLDPRIHLYEDIYKIKPVVNEQDFVQPNLDEVPQTSQNFLRNTDTSSSCSSSSSNDGEKIETIASIPSNDTSDKDQTNQSVDEGLHGLTPEFEVIDEVNSENHEVGTNIGNTDTLNFFMTSTVESIKQFLIQELELLESSKFELRNIHHRFFSFVEDDKLPIYKYRYKVEKKEKFYKSLNMLLFGKLQVKCGRVHKDKLKHFVNSTPGTLTREARESLVYSYDYIFRNSPHKNVNYKFFLKMIKNKYGNQIWLY